MIEQDTIRLLRECDAGIKMGISSLDDSVKYVQNPKLKSILDKSTKEHMEIKHDMQQLLDHAACHGKRYGVVENKY